MRVNDSPCYRTERTVKRSSGYGTLVYVSSIRPKMEDRIRHSISIRKSMKWPVELRSLNMFALFIYLFPPRPRAAFDSRCLAVPGLNRPRRSGGDPGRRIVRIRRPCYLRGGRGRLPPLRNAGRCGGLRSGGVQRRGPACHTACRPDAEDDRCAAAFLSRQSGGSLICARRLGEGRRVRAAEVTSRQQTLPCPRGYAAVSRRSARTRNFPAARMRAQWDNDGKARVLS